MRDMLGCTEGNGVKLGAESGETAGKLVANKHGQLPVV